MPKYPYRVLDTLFNRLFRNDLNSNFTDIAADLKDQKDRVDNLIKNVPHPDEVVDARKPENGEPFNLLGDRLNNFDEQLADNAQQLSDIDTRKADQSFVDSQFAAIVSGAPKATYTNLAAIQTAYPNGTDGVMLALDTGHWYYWNSTTSAWTDGGVYQSTGLGDGSVSYSNLKFPMARILNNNVLEVNFQTNKISVKGNVYLTSGGGNYTAIPSTYGDTPFPSDYSYGSKTYKAYVDLTDMSIHMVEISVDTGEKPILFVTYNRDIMTDSPHAIYKIDTSGKRTMKIGEKLIGPDDMGNAAVALKNTKFPVGEIFHKSSLEVNLQTKKVTVTDPLALYVFDEGTYAQYANTNTVLDISTVDLTSYTTYFIFIDRNETVNSKLKVAAYNSITSDNILVLCKICHDKVWCNEQFIKVINTDGTIKDVINLPDNYIKNSMLQAGIVNYNNLLYPMAYVFSNTYNAIEINFQKQQIIMNDIVYVLTGKGYQTVAKSTIDFPSGFSIGGATYKGYVDLTTNTIKMGALSQDTGNNPILFVTYNAKILTLNNQIVYTVDVNGKKELKLGQSVNDFQTDGYDWDTDKIVFPKELYLLKDVDYSINAQNFNYNKYTDDDRILFEMTTPAHTVAFENSGYFRIPLAYDFKTLLAGVHNGDTTNALLKDVTLRVADPATKTNKSPKVLYIGDSITHANVASLSNMWLKNFGFTPEFIGTIKDHNDFGYGIDETQIELVNGDGLSGWRLTDVTGTTKDTDGNIILHDNNPFWNPDANGGAGAFDFTYFMTQHGFDGIDFVVIMLGTNDIVGYSGNPNASKPSIDEICDYMPVEIQKIIDSIQAYNPNCKIGLNPPVPAGANDATNLKYMQYAQTMMDNFEKLDGKVYILSSYLGSGRLSGKAWDYYVTSIPDGQKATSGNVHDAGNNQTINALWSASWIINQSD